MSPDPIDGISGAKRSVETKISKRLSTVPGGTSVYAFVADGIISLKDFTKYVMNKEGLASAYGPFALDAARELALRHKSQGKVSSSDPEQPIPEGEQIELSVAELKAILRVLGSKSNVSSAKAIGTRPPSSSGGLDSDDD